MMFAAFSLVTWVSPTQRLYLSGTTNIKTISLDPQHLPPIDTSASTIAIYVPDSAAAQASLVILILPSPTYCFPKSSYACSSFVAVKLHPFSIISPFSSGVNVNGIVPSCEMHVNEELCNCIIASSVSWSNDSFSTRIPNTFFSSPYLMLPEFPN